MTVYLLWTLMAGAPVDVDAYLVKAQCEQIIVERRALLKDAIAQTKHPELEKIEFVGCPSVELKVPGNA